MEALRKRAPGAGRKPIARELHRRRVVLYVNPELAAYLEAEDLPAGSERNSARRRRRQEAAEMLLRANIENRII